MVGEKVDKERLVKWIERKIGERFVEKEEERAIERRVEVKKEEIEELKREIAKIEIPPGEMKEIEKGAEELKNYPTREKVRRVLILAATKNLKVAIETAKRLDDLTLDLVHDILAENKNYRKFL